MTETKAVRVSLLPDAVRREAFAEASRFRGEFKECLTARRDELVEPADAVLCADGARVGRTRWRSRCLKYSAPSEYVDGYGPEGRGVTVAIVDPIPPRPRRAIVWQSLAFMTALYGLLIGGLALWIMQLPRSVEDWQC